jgi:1-aminocyclopropane-1-carboxylate deaminase/D-cysteine desulfhydrase-like pyridoxal-dependent ACC family enzyme
LKSKSVQHRFGSEVKENSQFHHTTTEEDGVRLGCYGHIQDGKLYATQYVADARGYRTVHTYDDITVYPTQGPERFIHIFNL